MASNQQSVVEEQRELAERIARLTNVINGPKWIEFGRAERSRMLRRLSLMEQLDHVLLETIAGAEQP
jgi:hypothetical protein